MRNLKHQKTHDWFIQFVTREDQARNRTSVNVHSSVGF